MSTLYYDNTFHAIKMYHNAMIISEHEDDTIHYNQLKGKFMTAYLDSSKIKKVHIEENAQAIYYVTENAKDSLDQETKTITGMDHLECTEIIMRFIDGEAQTISFIGKPTSIYYPIEQIPLRELFFKGFSWQIQRKPDRPFPE